MQQQCYCEYLENKPVNFFENQLINRNVSLSDIIDIAGIHNSVVLSLELT